MKRKGKWERQIEANLDKLQTKLDPDGIIQNLNRNASVSFRDVKYSRCPFCLTKNLTSLFYMPIKNGVHKTLGECPVCHKLALFKTLTELEKWTPEKFAKWCFDYALSGFWDKVDFKRFTENLFKMGWSDLFWQKYHDLKGI